MLLGREVLWPEVAERREAQAVQATEAVVEARWRWSVPLSTTVRPEATAGLPPEVSPAEAQKARPDSASGEPVRAEPVEVELAREAERAAAPAERWPPLAVREPAVEKMTEPRGAILDSRRVESRQPERPASPPSAWSRD